MSSDNHEYKCPVCGRTYKSEIELNAHIESRHSLCSEILGIWLCPEDIVLINTGKNSVFGKILSTSGYSIIVETENGITTIKKNKINMINKRKVNGEK